MQLTANAIAHLTPIQEYFVDVSSGYLDLLSDTKSSASNGSTDDSSTTIQLDHSALDDALKKLYSPTTRSGPDAIAIEKVRKNLKF